MANAPLPVATPALPRRPPRRLVWFTLGLVTMVLAFQLTNRMTWPDAAMRPLLLSDTAGHADVIVVPGAGLTEACTPNLNSMRRTLLAARLYREGRAPVVLFSGGRPRTGDLHCTVGDVMAKLAIEVGVPAGAVRVEHDSRTTHKNAELSAPILRAMGAHRILIVTDRLHMVRATASYAHYGFAIERASIPIYEGHRDNVEMLAAGLRELVAIQWYKWKGWIDDPWTPVPAASTGTAASAPRPPARSGADARPLLVLRTAAGPAPADPIMLQTPALHPDGPIVILGASYAAGWKVATLGGVPVVNKGIAGQESFELLARFDADVVAARPRAVVLWGFANDVFRADRPKVDASMARMRASFTEMVAKARASGIEPILATEVTIREPNTWGDWFTSWVGWALGKTSYQRYVNGHILEGNRWLRELGAQQGLLVLDLHDTLSDDNGLRQKPFAHDDGSHINEAGYAAITAYADPPLAAHFRKS